MERIEIPTDTLYWAIKALERGECNAPDMCPGPDSVGLVMCTRCDALQRLRALLGPGGAAQYEESNAGEGREPCPRCGWDEEYAP